MPPALADDAASAEDDPGPVTLVRPADGASLPGARDAAGVSLAWGTPRSSPGWYFIEVLALGADGSREVFTGYTRQTEMRLPLNEAGQYAWRVLVVSRARARYSVSPWRSFTVEGAAKEGR